jgi:hypothetical protein
MNFYKDYSFLGCSLGDVQVFLKNVSSIVGTHLPKYTASIQKTGIFIATGVRTKYLSNVFKL